MAKTKAKIGHKTTFGMKIGENAEAFKKVADVTNLTPPGMTRDTVDATHLESPDGYKEFIAGLKEAGEATLTINYDPTESDDLVAAFEEGSGQFQITFPNKVTLTFFGIVTGVEWNDVVADDKMSATFTVKCSGRPVLGAAPPPAQGGGA